MNSYCVGGQSTLNIGKKLEHLVQASDFKNGPEIFLHGCERKFPAVILCVLHTVDQNGQAGAVQIGDLGKIDDHAFGFVGNDCAKRCSELWREVEIDFTIKRQYVCRRHFRPCTRRYPRPPTPQSDNYLALLSLKSLPNGAVS